LATAGPAEPLRRYFLTPDADAEVEELGLSGSRPPMLAADIPFPLPEVRAWAEHLLPAGFRGGLAAGLFSRTGRHVGFLSLLSDDPHRPDRLAARLIAAVAPVIADGLDRAREIGEAARMVGAATAGVVLSRGGDTLPLPGLPDHRLLTRYSPIVTAAGRELADDSLRSRRHSIVRGCNHFGPSACARTFAAETHYAASLMSAADQQIPDAICVVLEDSITET
jgi:hypothetical protein